MMAYLGPAPAAVGSRPGDTLSTGREQPTTTTAADPDLGPTGGSTIRPDGGAVAAWSSPSDDEAPTTTRPAATVGLTTVGETP